MPTPVADYLIFPAQNRTPSVKTPRRKLLFLDSDMEMKTVDPEGNVELLGDGTPGPAGEKGDQGEPGIQGPAGSSGAAGPAGADGEAATIAVGTVTTGAAGTDAVITNTGTTSAAVFDFTIPRGDTGAPGKLVAEAYFSTSTPVASVVMSGAWDQTKGVQIMAVSITPLSSTDLLTIDVFIPVLSLATSSTNLALFKDSDTTPLATSLVSIGNGFADQVSIFHRMTAGTTSTITFKVRFGADSIDQTAMYVASNLKVGSILVRETTP